MANKIEQKLLNALLDSYEKSKTFIGENKNQQAFRIQISKLFPKYDDDSEYEFYKEINTALANLETKGFVKLQKEKSGKVKTVLLELSKLSEVYEFIKRTPKFETNNSLQNVWNNFADICLVRVPEEARRCQNLQRTSSRIYFPYLVTDRKSVV